MAVFTSRIRSNTAARATAVLRSSGSAAAKSFSASAARLGISGFEPAPNFSVFKRATKLRMRSTELSACFKPSIVKFSWRLYGTERRGLGTLGEEIAQRIEIAERLGHLFAFDDQVLGVQPEFRELLSRGGFAFGDFVFVVREGEIDAAGGDVQRLAEVFHRHRSAFDVPAGSAGADGRFPEKFARL